MSEQAQRQDHELKPHGDELAKVVEPRNDSEKQNPQQPANSGNRTKE